MKLLVVFLALCGFAAVGCSSTVSGNGHFAQGGGETSPSQDPTEPSDPSGNPSGGATSGGTDDDGGGSDGGGGSCPDSDDTVSTESYCFTVPDGFSQDSDFDFPGSGRDTVMVSVGQVDLIALTVLDTGDTSDLDDDVLRDANDQAIATAFDGVYELDPPRGDQLEVDGDRAYHNTANDVSGEGGIDVYTIYRDHNKVQVNCQYETNKATIQSGCDALLDSFHTIGD